MSDTVEKNRCVESKKADKKMTQQSKQEQGRNQKVTQKHLQRVTGLF